MTATLPYTVILADIEGRYTVSYVELPAGLAAARKTLEESLAWNAYKRVVTLIPGTHDTDLTSQEVNLGNW